MSRSKLTHKEIDAVLESLLDASCNAGCKCIFCRTFDAGVESGKHDAAIEFERVLKNLRKAMGA